MIKTVDIKDILLFDMRKLDLMLYSYVRGQVDKGERVSKAIICFCDAFNITNDIISTDALTIRYWRLCNTMDIKRMLSGINEFSRDIKVIEAHIQEVKKGVAGK